MKNEDKGGMNSYLPDLDKDKNEIYKNVTNIRGNKMANTTNDYKTKYIENNMNDNEETTRVSIKNLYHKFNKTRNILIENEEESKMYKNNINKNISNNERFLTDVNFNYASNKTQKSINSEHFFEKNKVYQYDDNKIKKGNKSSNYDQNKNIRNGKINQKTTIMDYFQPNYRYKSDTKCKSQLENQSEKNKNQFTTQFRKYKEVNKNGIAMCSNEMRSYNAGENGENGENSEHGEHGENSEHGEHGEKLDEDRSCDKKKYNIIDERNGNVECNSNSLKHMSIENIKKILRSNKADTLKILLCTDNHLGYKENNPIQKKDTFNTFEEILFIAKKLNVDMILNSGDLFHKNKVSEYTLFKTMSIIRKYCHVHNTKDDERYQNANLNMNHLNVNHLNMNHLNMNHLNIQQKPDISSFPESQMHASEYSTLLNEVTNYRYDFYEGDENVSNTFFECEEKEKSQRCQKNEIKEMRETERFQSNLDENYDEIKKNIQYKTDNEITNKSYKEEYNKEMKIHPVNEKFEKSIPFYTIHGNHDYPYSYDYICPLDILNISNLINYIGKNNMEKLIIKPILLNKKGTNISIYAIGWIKDERLYNYFENKNIKFIIPEDYKNRINILLLHQNRYMRNTNSNNSKNYIKESFIPSFIDLVIWGHEHNSKPQLEESLFHTFYNLQLGSSVRTSLCINEYGDKYIGLLEVKNERFRFLKINLETVRPFELKEIKLANYDLNFNDEYVLKQFLHDQTNLILDKIRKQLLNKIKNYYLFKKIFFPSLFEKEKNDKINSGTINLEEENIILSITDKCVNDFFAKLQNDDFYSTSFIHLAFFSEEYDTFNLLKIKKNVYNKPLIKIKIEYNEINIINTQLFGCEFIDKITNPSEFLSFYKKKTKIKDLQDNETYTNGSNNDKIDAEDKENMNMEYINEYNKVFDILFDYCDIKNDLLILNQKIIMDTIQNVIINTNPSFGSDGNVNSNYNSLEIMAEKISDEKIKTIMNKLKDIPVDHITNDYIETVGKSINSTISEMNK
ncbi:hypothetical protein YYC_02298 [Plasmodium yoelii 17X]|uniref:Mre11 DNA-binding domain-containing protein n=1 Tax=Plasmodium yoelii 17X TaxID=1323249 RepID=V7PPL8_PLAYE|nr:hypothetical protein YYC_02298 [Plasmodium yoelii 17X]